VYSWSGDGSILYFVNDFYHTEDEIREIVIKEASSAPKITILGESSSSIELPSKEKKKKTTQTTHNFSSSTTLDLTDVITIDLTSPSTSSETIDLSGDSPTPASKKSKVSSSSGAIKKPASTDNKDLKRKPPHTSRIPPVPVAAQKPKDFNIKLRISLVNASNAVLIANQLIGLSESYVKPLSAPAVVISTITFAGNLGTVKSYSVAAPVVAISDQTDTEQGVVVAQVHGSGGFIRMTQIGSKLLDEAKRAGVILDPTGIFPRGTKCFNGLLAAYNFSLDHEAFIHRTQPNGSVVPKKVTIGELYRELSAPWNFDKVKMNHVMERYIMKASDQRRFGTGKDQCVVFNVVKIGEAVVTSVFDLSVGSDFYSSIGAKNIRAQHNADNLTQNGGKASYRITFRGKDGAIQHSPLLLTTMKAIRFTKDGIKNEIIGPFSGVEAKRITQNLATAVFTSADNKNGIASVVSDDGKLVALITRCGEGEDHIDPVEGTANHATVVALSTADDKKNQRYFCAFLTNAGVEKLEELDNDFRAWPPMKVGDEDVNSTGLTTRESVTKAAVESFSGCDGFPTRTSFVNQVGRLKKKQSHKRNTGIWISKYVEVHYFDGTVQDEAVGQGFPRKKKAEKNELGDEDELAKSTEK